MKIDELRNLNKDDLSQKLKELSGELVKLNYQKRIGSLDKPHQFQAIRNDIARIKTLLRELELKETNKGN